MNRLLVCAVSLVIVASISACSFKKSPSTNTANQSASTENKNSSTKSATTQPPAAAGDLQPGQASGTFTAKGETVELKYAYAGRATRFGDETLVILLTDQPIPADAVAEEIKSTPLLEGEKIRGLEYAMMGDEGMWVRFHPSQYQESGSMKLKDYKVEGDIVRGTDDNEGSLSDGKYGRKVKFVATIVK